MKYVRVSFNRHWWSFLWDRGEWIGVFRNKHGVIPGRWGVYFFGIEIGSRNPGDPVGVWLKSHGLWPF